MENFFLKGFVCWRHERAHLEYEAHSHNWIWLDKFTNYVIIMLNNNESGFEVEICVIKKHWLKV